MQILIFAPMWKIWQKGAVWQDLSSMGGSSAKYRTTYTKTNTFLKCRNYIIKCIQLSCLHVVTNEGECFNSLTSYLISQSSKTSGDNLMIPIDAIRATDKCILAPFPILHFAGWSRQEYMSNSQWLFQLRKSKSWNMATEYKKMGRIVIRQCRVV